MIRAAGVTNRQQNRREHQGVASRRHRGLGGRLCRVGGTSSGGRFAAAAAGRRMARPSRPGRVALRSAHGTAVHRQPGLRLVPVVAIDMPASRLAGRDAIIADNERGSSDTGTSPPREAQRCVSPSHVAPGAVLMGMSTRAASSPGSRVVQGAAVVSPADRPARAKCADTDPGGRWNPAGRPARQSFAVAGTRRARARPPSCSRQHPSGCLRCSLPRGRNRPPPLSVSAGRRTFRREARPRPFSRGTAGASCPRRETGAR